MNLIKVILITIIIIILFCSKLK